MAFKDGYRLEKVYFENIYTLLNTLKSMKGTEADFDTVRELLDNAIADNESIILIYKNLGELYNEVAIRFTELDKQLKDLRTNLDEWKDEINEKIDEVNNYIMNFIREILERLDVIEADLAQMGRVLTYDIERVNNEWEMKEQNTPVTFQKTSSYFTHERPHLVLVRGELNDEVTYLFPREYDTTENTGLFEWYTMGFVGNEIHEITVTLLPDDSVNVAINTTDFAGILQRLSTAETNITDLQGRMTNAETDIDTLEQTAESHNDRITDLETCCDDVETALDGKQDTLVAGSGIAIDPTTNEISATVTTYNGGYNIDINNNIVSSKLRIPKFANDILIGGLRYKNSTLPYNDTTDISTGPRVDILTELIDPSILFNINNLMVTVNPQNVGSFRNREIHGGFIYIPQITLLIFDQNDVSQGITISDNVGAVVCNFPVIQANDNLPNYSSFTASAIFFNFQKYIESLDKTQRYKIRVQFYPQWYVNGNLVSGAYINSIFQLNIDFRYVCGLYSQ